MSAALKFLQLIAIGLGLPENYFYHLFVPETLSTLRLLHYPQRDFETPAVAIENGQVVVCETHIDSGFVTLLTTFDFTGKFFLSLSLSLSLAPSLPFYSSLPFSHPTFPFTLLYFFVYIVIVLTILANLGVF